MECRALAGYRFGPNPPAVAMDDALHCGEPDPGAGELPGQMEPLERPEEAIDVRHLEPRPVVPDEVGSLPPQARLAKLDARRLGSLGELPSVLQEVFEGDPQQLAVAPRGDTRPNAHLELAVRLDFPQP